MFLFCGRFSLVWLLFLVQYIVLFICDIFDFDETIN
uniref:Uncharacterized protein n=1 Tax=Anguilla anguilla TaxID=7936 RepID=A0A0E9X7K2_ANGAN